jgi:hypothetical protein
LVARPFRVCRGLVPLVLGPHWSESNIDTVDPAGPDFRPTCGCLFCERRVLGHPARRIYAWLRERFPVKGWSGGSASIRCEHNLSCGIWNHDPADVIDTRDYFWRDATIWRLFGLAVAGGLRTGAMF